MLCLLITFLNGCAQIKTEYKYYPLQPIYCHRTVKPNRDIYACFDEYKSKYNAVVKLTNPEAYK